MYLTGSEKERDPAFPANVREASINFAENSAFCITPYNTAISAFLQGRKDSCPIT